MARGKLGAGDRVDGSQVDGVRGELFGNSNRVYGFCGVHELQVRDERARARFRCRSIDWKMRTHPWSSDLQVHCVLPPLLPFSRVTVWPPVKTLSSAISGAKATWVPKDEVGPCESSYSFLSKSMNPVKDSNIRTVEAPGPDNATTAVLFVSKRWGKYQEELRTIFVLVVGDYRV